VRILKIVLFCVFVTTATVAIAQQIQTDYDHTTDFSKYRTFMWIKEPKPENPLMKQRIIDAINAQLEAKGLRLVTTNADLGVSANSATRQEHTLESFYDGFPGWGWRRYWGPVTTAVETWEVGTLVVDLFDNETKQIKWWGSATDTISDKPEKNAKKLDEAVTKMFKHFPPGSPKTD
jgi:Domain of unknown function (DUF4136)